MIRIFLAMGIGAALMYLFDPRQGKERREMLSDRMHQGREQAQQAVDTGKSVVEQARETAAEARDRMDATFAEAKRRLGRDAEHGEEATSEMNIQA